MRSVYRFVGCVIFAAAKMPAAYAQIPAAVSIVAVDLEASASDASAGRFSMATAAPIQIRDALRLLVRGTRFRVVLDPAVTGVFAGDLKDVTPPLEPPCGA